MAAGGRGRSWRRGWDRSRERSSVDPLQIVERRGPAAPVIVARRLIEELLVRQRQDRAVIVGLEVDRDLRFALGRALPGPGEDQLAVGHDLAIDAAHALVRAVGRPELHVEAAADAQVGLGDGRLVVAGDAPPADHFFRLRPAWLALAARPPDAS